MRKLRPWPQEDGDDRRRDRNQIWLWLACFPLPIQRRMNQTEKKKSLTVQSTVILGLGFQFLEHHQLLGINQTFLR